VKSKIFIIFLTVCMSVPVFGQSGGSLGMAGAYTTVARGSEAIFWNPANLAFLNEGRPAFTATLFSTSLAITNNAFNLDDYDTYFTDEDKVLSQAEKDDIRGKVPDSGLEIDMRSDVEFLAMAYKNFAFSFSSYGFTEAKAPQDFFDNVFEGFEQRRYNYSTTVDAELAASFNLAYGHTFWRNKSVVIPFIDYPLNLTEIALGGMVSYNMGLFAFESEQADLVTDITDNGIRAFGRFQGNGARLVRKLNDEGEWDTEFDDEETFVGSGFGLNLALSAKTDKDYVLSLVVKNIYNRTTWNKSTLHVDREINTGDDYKFFTGENQLDDLDEDDITHDNDTEIGDFTTTRPLGFRIGAGRELGRYSYASEIGWEDEEFMFATGGSVRWAIFNIYAGYGFKYGHSFNFGFGLGNEYLMFDLGLGTHDGITPGGTKGLLLASSLRFGF